MKLESGTDRPTLVRQRVFPILVRERKAVPRNPPHDGNGSLRTIVTGSGVPTTPEQARALARIHPDTAARTLSVPSIFAQIGKGGWIRPSPAHGDRPDVCTAGEDASQRGLVDGSQVIAMLDPQQFCTPQAVEKAGHE